jgi:hypothetical protein
MMRSRKLYPQAASTPNASGWLGAVLAALVLGQAPLAAAAEPSAAAAVVTVEAVQWPVWVERNGERRPLAAGQSLQNLDRLATGNGGRALLRWADGSGVKLGENAQLDLAGLARSKDGVMSASLAVARGAFRFTTGLFKGVLKRREVNVTVVPTSGENPTASAISSACSKGGFRCRTRKSPNRR